MEWSVPPAQLVPPHAVRPVAKAPRGGQGSATLGRSPLPYARTMRILHTSDWHLGVKRQQLDFAEEHTRFLAWLLDTMRERAVEVLVVAGDVFHHAQPSNAARSMYYRFLAACQSIESLRKVVVVAGNHDSPSGIDAPRDVLEALDVAVVGGLPRELAARTERCLVPIRDDSGEVALVVAAVPYVQEAILGVELGEGGIDAMERRYADAFQHAYAELADAAQAAYPNAAYIATGHLTAYGSDDAVRPGDYQTPLHRTAPAREADAPGEDDAALRVGTLKALHPDVFDPRYQYVALGHIHRPMPVGGKRHIRYSGTPVATDRTETSPERQVLLVDVVANQDAEVTKVPVPVWRDLIALRGAPDELRHLLRALKSDAELPPAVYLDVALGADDARGQNWLTDFHAVLDERPSAEPRPLLIEVREVATTPAPESAPAAMPPLEQLSELDVFKAMYRRKHKGSEDGIAPLIEAFQTLVQSLADTDGGQA